MPYTKDGVMAQMFVAFGQGTGSVRVSRDACAAFHSRYYDWIDEALLAAWGNEAVQILERVRAIGRSLAFQASLEGQTAIDGSTVLAVARAVEEGESCPWCPAQREKAGRPSPVAQPSARDAILGQMLVAFGQGTGAVRLSQGACVAFRDRYFPWLDDGIVALWDTAAVQVLERVRAIGRLLAARAGIEGRTAIAAAGVLAAARLVEEVGDCPYCPIHQERAQERTQQQVLAAGWEETGAALPVV
jgi:hypothetical protein